MVFFIFHPFSKRYPSLVSKPLTLPRRYETRYVLDPTLQGWTWTDVTDITDLNSGEEGLSEKEWTS